MKRKILTLAAALLTSAALAALTPPVQTIQTVTTTTVGGKSVEVLKDTTTATPGTILQGTHVITLPAPRPGATSGPRYTVGVPVQGSYLPGSASADNKAVTITFALTKDGPYSAKPTKTVTITENGQKVTKIVPADPSEYRFVRYEFGDLQGKVTVKLRYRVN